MARQRWRLTVARDAPNADLPERAALEALASGLREAGVPIAVSGAARPRLRIAFAAPLPRGAAAEAEPVEAYLGERLTVAEMRRLVGEGLPPGFRLVALEDEWVGAPSLASRVTAVEYRADVDLPATEAPADGMESLESGPESPEGGTLDRARVVAAAEHVVDKWPGGGLRIVVAAWDEGARSGVLVVRFTRDQAGRLGRPTEAVDELGLGLRVTRLVRTAVDVGVAVG